MTQKTPQVLDTCSSCVGHPLGRPWNPPPWLAAGYHGLSEQQPESQLNLPFSGWSLMSASLGWLGLSDWLESEKHKNTAKNYRVCERKWIRGGRLSQEVQRVNQEWEHYRSAMMIKNGRKKRQGEGQPPQQPVPSERTAGSVHTSGSTWLAPDHNLKLFRNHPPTQRPFPNCSSPLFIH